MIYKKAIFLCLLLSAYFVQAASYTDQAEVISVEDVYKNHTTHTPYKDCYDKEFFEKDKSNSITNELVGGILGGAIGNQFGSGSGKDAMTMAGVALGVSIAHDDKVANASGRVVTRRVCETKYHTNTVRRFDHYLVKYKYNSRIFTYRTEKKPDQTIQVGISVMPK